MLDTLVSISKNVFGILSDFIAIIRLRATVWAEERRVVVYVDWRSAWRGACGEEQEGCEVEQDDGSGSPKRPDNSGGDSVERLRSKS